MEETKRNFFEITVKAVILNEKNEALLIKRHQDNHYGAGKWDFPGGKLEAGEYIQEGLCREIQEEIGIEVELIKVISVNDFGKKYDKKCEIGKEKLLVAGKGLRFLARYKSGEVTLSDEHEKYEWLDLDKALACFGESDFEIDKKEALVATKKHIEMKEGEDKWKRSVADFENYKKRITKERSEMIAYSNVSLISEILPVLDNFHVSTEHIPKDQEENVWVVGIMHIQKQLEKVLEDNGIEEIEAKVGDKFDPNFHEAIEAKVEKEKEKKTNKKAESKIKKIAQKGYKIGGRVIRPARVLVE